MAAAELFGWPRVAVMDMSGSGTGEITLRACYAGRSAVFKRYPPAAFAAARLVAGLPRAPFAPLLGESRRLRVLAFEDLGRDVFAHRLPARAIEAAAAYVECVREAADAFSALGSPAPVSPTASINDFLGFVPLTPTARRVCSPARQLRAIAECTRAEAVPAAAFQAAIKTDRMLATEMSRYARRRRWILADSNPSNLVVTPTGTARWVDVMPAPGLIDTNFLSLAGAQFRLNEGQLADVLKQDGAHSLGPMETLTLNAMFSVFTHCDTTLGLASGRRDGTIHAGLTYRESDSFSLSLAADYFGRGVPIGRGYLPLVEWLTATPGHYPGLRSKRAP